MVKAGVTPPRWTVLRLFKSSPSLLKIIIREENNNEKVFSFAFHDSGTRHESAGEP